MPSFASFIVRVDNVSSSWEKTKIIDNSAASKQKRAKELMSLVVSRLS